MDRENSVYIEEVKTFSPETADSIRNLVRQLDANFQPLTDDDIHFMIQSKNTHIFLARQKKDERIIGMITLIVYRIPYKMKGQLEDIVIDESMRGRGTGTALLQFAVNRARELGVKSLNLTSNPTREAANKLYLSLGFEKRDTNVYRLNL